MSTTIILYAPPLPSHEKKKHQNPKSKQWNCNQEKKNHYIKLVIKGYLILSTWEAYKVKITQKGLSVQV